MPVDGVGPDQLRAAYDAVAERYAETYVRELEHKPLDRVLLSWFADEVRGRGPVADLGTGPGHVARFLHERGVEAFGVDLSHRTIALARERHRDRGMIFREGDFFALDLPDASLAGATAFYAHVHVPAVDLPRAFGELARVLRPGAPALLAFHVADATLHLDEWLGARVSVDWYFWPVATVIAALEAAGLAAEVKVERAPYVPHEHPTLRGYVLARRPAVEVGNGDDARGAGATDAAFPPRRARSQRRGKPAAARPTVIPFATRRVRRRQDARHARCPASL